MIVFGKTVHTSACTFEIGVNFFSPVGMFGDANCQKSARATGEFADDDDHDDDDDDAH